MQQYPLPSLKNEELSALLEQADRSPILLTDSAEPRYIVLSVQNYQEFICSLQELEDQAWGEAAQKALQSSQMVGSEKFMAALQQILDSEQDID